MARSLYIIDGHAQIYRSYYAPFQNLTAPSGEPVRATHVFWATLFNLVRDRKPDFLAMALDTSDETVFRRAIDPEYKAHREPPPEDLPVQADRIVAMAEAMRMPLLRVPGYEADDIIATLCRQLAGPDLHVFIVSRDKDLDQLLGPHVSLFDLAKGQVVTPESLVEEKGWRPDQAIEAQILVGDTVDNVRGVSGIGPKTAAKLLAKYGSARAVIDHADELTPKQRENVLAFAPHLETTRALVTLDSHTPLSFDLEAARIESLRWDALPPVIRQLGFKRLPEQTPFLDVVREEADLPEPAPSPAAKPPAGEPTDAPDVADAGLDPAADFMRAGGNAAAIARDPTLERPDGGVYRLVNTPEALAELVAALSKQEAFCFDTETTGVSPIDCELVGLAFSWSVGEGWYIPLRCVFDGALSAGEVLPAIAPFLADEARTKVGHHLKYDIIVLRQAGVEVRGPLFDTMVAAFVLDPMQRSYKLDTLAAGLLAHEMIPISDLIGKGRDQLTMDQVPLSQICEYAGEDADYTWRLYRLFEPQIRGSDRAALFYETEMPLVSVLTDMEHNGIRVDTEFLRTMSAELARRGQALVDEVHALVGRRFNLDSPKQLGEVLFDQLGFRVVKKTRTARSTDAETLEQLAAETGHPALQKLLEYREIQKLRGTYVDALPQCVARRSGRVHTSYHQTGAITGRLSSSEPNLQNIPIRTELGRRIRRAFVPRSPEERLIVADYSQIELRVLAHFCGDEELIRAFAADQDIHAFVAAQINNVPLQEVTREQRGRAKAVNFGLIYGQTAHGLAQGTGMSRGDAQAFIDAYFRKYPRIRGFIDECIAMARRDGFVRTIEGRRRPIPDINSQNRPARAQAERLAVNTVIQGSAADLIKIAMVRLHRRIAAESLPLRMLLQVHDELVCEAPVDRAEAMAGVVVEVMSGAMALRVPLKVDAHVAENWLEAK